MNKNDSLIRDLQNVSFNKDSIRINSNLSMDKMSAP